MGFFDSIKAKAFGQFVDVIEWIDDTRNTMVWKFPRGDNEIKNGTQLIVRESQAAVFLHEGELGDVFKPGRFELTTKNIPVLTTLKSWKYAFDSPFKCDVYFVNTHQFTDQKWGTGNPIMLRDPEFGPIRMRAFGSYAFAVADPGKFIVALAGTGSLLVSEDVTGQLRNLLVSRFSDALGEAGIPALDLAARYTELGDKLRDIIQGDFDEYGIVLSKFLIENISVPKEVEEAVDKRTQMGILGDMNKYTQFQAANALGDAAKNQGAAGGMMGMLAGINLGGIMSRDPQAAAAVNAPPRQPADGAVPPAFPDGPIWFAGIDGKQTGPLDAGQLAAKVAALEITRDTLMWKQGMPGWVKAADIAALSGLFGPESPPSPPPLPPA